MAEEALFTCAWGSGKELEFKLTQEFLSVLRNAKIIFQISNALGGLIINTKAKKKKVRHIFALGNPHIYPKIVTQLQSEKPPPRADSCIADRAGSRVSVKH